jgi:hypothetical protein
VQVIVPVARRRERVSVTEPLWKFCDKRGSGNPLRIADATAVRDQKIAVACAVSAHGSKHGNTKRAFGLIIRQHKFGLAGLRALPILRLRSPIDSPA